MKRELAIYLAGAIQKGHETHGTFWGEPEMQMLRELLPDVELKLLNPANRMDDISDQRAVFGRDMAQVYLSHVVFVDARDLRGVGVGAEMMWAKMNTIPLVTWAPRNTHYRKDQTSVLGVSIRNFIHPFVEALSDQVVETLQEGAEWIRDMQQASIKGPSDIIAAMEYYKETQFHQDLPMQAFLHTKEALELRLRKQQPFISDPV